MYFSGGSIAALTRALPAAASGEDSSVALVLGAFSDNSAWHRVIPLRQDAGVPVSRVQLPLTSRQGDADVVSRVIEMQDGPVVLVGRYYGGNVITQARAYDSVEVLLWTSAARGNPVAG